MYGLVDRVAAGLPIGDAAEAGAGQQADAPRDDARLVGDDVAEEVARDDDAVEGRGILNHDHGGAVDELVLDLEVRELARERLLHDGAPEAARREHVGLVERPDLLVAAAAGQEARQARDALDLGARVGLRVPGVARAVVLLALAEVDAARELADDDEVGAAAHGRLERGRVDEGVGREEAGSQVAVRAHLLAQLQQPLLRADGAGAPFGAADGAEEDGVGGLRGGERLVGEGSAVGVDGALEGEGVVRCCTREIVCVCVCVRASGWVRRSEEERDRGRSLTPPIRCSWRLNLPTLGLAASMARRTCTNQGQPSSCVPVSSCSTAAASRPSIGSPVRRQP